MSTDLDTLKAESRFLRGSLKTELDGDASSFSTDAQHLLKPHGLYQQKDRDRRAETLPSPPALMVRGRIPAGRLAPGAWLAWDALADAYGDGSLRITTRQSLELHGVLKADLRFTLKGLREALQTSQGACGDVARNVLAPPNPTQRPELTRLAEEAARLSEHTRATSRAYAEIFLDGEPVDPATELEPLYGPTYLPRKFKIALTLAGENAVDLLTHDLGLAATFEGEEDAAGGLGPTPAWGSRRGDAERPKGAGGPPSPELTGWHLFVGGGMGMTHGNDATFPRLADHLGWFPHGSLLPVVEAVIAAYRDSGNRENRKRARLKYLLHDRGVDWFRTEVEARSGVAFLRRDPPAWTTPTYLGWQEALDGTWSLGFHTLSGRVQGALKRALREVIAGFGLEVQLTPEQDLLLLGIQPDARGDLEAAFGVHGVAIPTPTTLASRALACVALPWCGLAVAEAERILPELLAALDASLERHGRADLAPTFRVTGCANGCARPYAAELALVGQTPGRYVLWVGGDTEGTRLAFPVAEKVPTSELPGFLDRLVALWAAEGGHNERLGAFAQRLRPAAFATALTRVPAES